jgi:hypothetical protein
LVTLALLQSGGEIVGHCWLLFFVDFMVEGLGFVVAFKRGEFDMFLVGRVLRNREGLEIALVVASWRY